MRFGIPAQKTRAWRDSTTGVPRIAGSNLAKSNEPLCRPPAPAGSANRRVDQFHPASCTAVSLLVQCRPAISPVSPYRRGRNDYEYFFQLIMALMVLRE